MYPSAPTRAQEGQHQSPGCHDEADLQPSLLYHLVAPDADEQEIAYSGTRGMQQCSAHRNKRFKSVWEDLYIPPGHRHLFPRGLPPLVKSPHPPQIVTSRELFAEREAAIDAERLVDKDKFWWRHEVQEALSMGPPGRVPRCLDVQDHDETLKFIQTKPTLAQVIQEYMRKRRQYSSRDVKIMAGKSAEKRRAAAMSTCGTDARTSFRSVQVQTERWEPPSDAPLPAIPNSSQSTAVNFTGEVCESNVGGSSGAPVSGPSASVMIGPPETATASLGLSHLAPAKALGHGPCGLGVSVEVPSLLPPETSSSFGPVVAAGTVPSSHAGNGGRKGGDHHRSREPARCGAITLVGSSIADSTASSEFAFPPSKRRSPARHADFADAPALARGPENKWPVPMAANAGSLALSFPSGPAKPSQVSEKQAVKATSGFDFGGESRSSPDNIQLEATSGTPVSGTAAKAGPLGGQPSSGLHVSFTASPTGTLPRLATEPKSANSPFTRRVCPDRLFEAKARGGKEQSVTDT